MKESTKFLLVIGVAAALCIFLLAFDNAQARGYEEQRTNYDRGVSCYEYVYGAEPVAVWVRYEDALQVVYGKGCPSSRQRLP